MRSIFITIVSALICYPLFSQQVSFDKKRLNRIDQWIEKDIKNAEMQGATIMIADAENVLYSYIGGKSNIETNRNIKKGDFFKIASMSKIITTVAVMQLYEKGYFDLDDPLYRYLPEFRNMKVFHPESKVDSLVKAVRPITIRHMLNHTAGFTYGNEKTSKVYKEKEIYFFNPRENNLKEFAQKMSTVPLTAQPGDKFEYGPSTDILGYLVEKTSGMNLEEYFSKYIFTPLGMTHTGFNVHRKTPEKLVRTYRRRGDKLVLSNSKGTDFDKNYYAKVFMGGSGLVSTAEDYLKFLQMLLNNGTYKNKVILSRKSVELMTSDQTPGINYPNRYDNMLGGNNTFGFSLNVITSKGASKEMYSEGSYFWEGSFSTSFIVDPKEGFAAVIMTQISGRKSLEIRKRFRQFVYGALK